MLDETAIDHFRQGQLALIRKRDELNRAIEQVDRILGILASGGEIAATAAQLTHPDAKPTVREAILASMAKVKGPWRVAQIISALHDVGVDAKDASVRSILVKMVERGELTNPMRGFYDVSSRTSPIKGDGAGETSGVPAPVEKGGPDEDHHLGYSHDDHHHGGTPVAPRGDE